MIEIRVLLSMLYIASILSLYIVKYKRRGGKIRANRVCKKKMDTGRRLGYDRSYRKDGGRTEGDLQWN
jgi:hypothetical protein